MGGKNATEAYTAAVRKKVAKKEFDLVYYNREINWFGIDTLLTQNYNLQDSFTVNFRHVYLKYNVEVWRPKP